MADDAGMASTAQNLVLAVNALTTALTKVLAVVQSTAATATAGSATLPSAPAKFINVTLPDGTAGKVAVYNP